MCVRPRHSEIWAVQQKLDFPSFVFGLQRAGSNNSPMRELTERYARALGTHRNDRSLP